MNLWKLFTISFWGGILSSKKKKSGFSWITHSEVKLHYTIFFLHRLFIPLTKISQTTTLFFRKFLSPSAFSCHEKTIWYINSFHILIVINSHNRQRYVCMQFFSMQVFTKYYCSAHSAGHFTACEKCSPE